MRKIKSLAIQGLQILEGYSKSLLGKQYPYELTRKSICSICDINDNGVCSKELGGCGCNIEAKIKCKGCKCPLNYW